MSHAPFPKFPYTSFHTRYPPLPTCPWHNPQFDPTAVNIHTLRDAEDSFDTALKLMIQCKCIDCQGYLKHAWVAAHTPAASAPVLDWFNQQPSGVQVGPYPFDIQNMMVHSWRLPRHLRNGPSDADRFTGDSINTYGPAIHFQQSGGLPASPLALKRADTRYRGLMQHSLTSRGPPALDIGRPAMAMPADKTYILSEFPERVQAPNVINDDSLQGRLAHLRLIDPRASLPQLPPLPEEELHPYVRGPSTPPL